MTLDEFIEALQAIRDAKDAGSWPVYAEGDGGAYDPIPVTDLLVEPAHCVLLVPQTFDDRGHEVSNLHVFELKPEPPKT